jgi:hypothetical protein
VTATLTDDGWVVPESEPLERILNLMASTSQFGPADGDPVSAAAQAAANLLDGRVIHVRPVPDYPPGTVF